MHHSRTRRIIIVSSCVALAVSHFSAGLSGRSCGLGLIVGNVHLAVPANLPAISLARSAGHGE